MAAAPAVQSAAAQIPAEARIETGHRRLLVACDGEVEWMETPLNYRIRPGALRVLVPEEKAVV